MKVVARFGTPSHMEPHEYVQPGQAKNFLAGKMDDRAEWAAKFNHEAARRLGAAKEELSGLNIQALKVGDVRSWEVLDDVSGVRFRYEIEKLEE